MLRETCVCTVIQAESRRVAICAESSGCLRMLTVAQVAKEIAGFEGMGAHRLKGELRGHQPARGSALRFSDLIIKEIMEGTHAISGKKWEMASIEDDRWPEEDEGLPASAEAET